MSEHNHIIHDQKQVDLEDYIAGMMQAAEIAEQHLQGQAAALIRGSAAVLRRNAEAYNIHTEASRKATEANMWYLPHRDTIYLMMDGRLASRVYGALTNFESEADFLQATDHDLESIPFIGQKTLEVLVKLQENWR